MTLSMASKTTTIFVYVFLTHSFLADMMTPTSGMVTPPPPDVVDLSLPGPPLPPSPHPSSRSIYQQHQPPQYPPPNLPPPQHSPPIHIPPQQPAFITSLHEPQGPSLPSQQFMQPQPLGEAPPASSLPLPQHPPPVPHLPSLQPSFPPQQSPPILAPQLPMQEPSKVPPWGGQPILPPHFSHEPSLLPQQSPPIETPQVPMQQSSHVPSWAEQPISPPHLQHGPSIPQQELPPHQLSPSPPQQFPMQELPQLSPPAKQQLLPPQPTPVPSVTSQVKPVQKTPSSLHFPLQQPLMQEPSQVAPPLQKPPLPIDLQPITEYKPMVEPGHQASHVKTQAPPSAKTSSSKQPAIKQSLSLNSPPKHQNQYQRQQQQEHHEHILERNPYGYEVDVDKRGSDVNRVSKFHSTASAPQANFVYEYDFIEPDPTPTPSPVYKRTNALYLVNHPKARKNPKLHLSYDTRVKNNYQTSYAHNAKTVQKPVIQNYAYTSRLAALRNALSYAARRRQASSRQYTPRSFVPSSSTISRTQLDERQKETPHLYSSYPLRTVVAAAAARGISCKSLYEAYRLLPMTSYPSYCGRGLSCPSPLVTEIQVGRTCLCCSSFGQYI